MTTHTLSGFSITSTNDVPSGFAATTMALTTSGSFTFKYTMDAASPTGFSSITLNNPYGDLVQAIIGGSTRFDVNTYANVAEYTWQDGANTRKTVMLMIDFGGDVQHFFALGGADLPEFANLAAYQAFLEDLTATNSASISAGNAYYGPGKNLLLSSMDAWVSPASDNDRVVFSALFDDWSVSELETGAGNDTVIGGSAVDKIALEDGNDYADGYGSNDVIWAGAGNDTVYGSYGNDYLSGGTGADYLYGENGNDSMAGGLGNDTMNGGSENDRINGDDGADILYGTTGNDTLNGGLGNDTVDGGGDDDIVSGGAGHDSLDGSGGADTLAGGGGADTLDGGSGYDVLNGNAGADVIIFSEDYGRDTVNGFENDIDTLHLSESLGITTAAEALELATQNARGVTFEFATGDILVMSNVTKAALLDDISII